MKKVTKAILNEKLEECKKALKEKKLQEASFRDLIKPFLDLLNTVHSAKESGELDLPPLDDDKIDISKMLDTSEEDISATDGTLTEEYYNKKSRILQEAGRSYNQIVADYISEGGTQDYEEFRTWGQKQPDVQKVMIINNWNFRKLYAQMNYSSATDGTGSAGAVEAGVAPVQDPNYEMSDNLKSVIDASGAGEDWEESALTTVTDKYDNIELLMRRVIRGRSAKRYYILAGDAGIGKTYTVAKLLKEEGKADDIDSITYTGSIGRSVTSIATFLWLHRNDEILVLDDCDSFLRKGNNPDVTNILKGCMEAGTGYRVGIPSSIAARVTKDLRRQSEAKVSDKVKALFESEDEELDDDENIDITDVDLENDDDAVPTSWTWNARMVIISNLHESQIEEPLWSRCDHFDLHLTQEEYLIRLAMIIDGMDVGQKDGLCTPEEAMEAKALVLSVMKAVIEAGNHGVQLYGKFVRLTDHLEFRIVKDLVNMWLALLENEMEKYPEKSREDAKNDIMQRWVRTGVIPRMSARKVL